MAGSELLRTSNTGSHSVKGRGRWGQALSLPNKVLLSLLPPTSFTCKSVCAHKSQLSRARNLPSPGAAVPASAARTAEPTRDRPRATAAEARAKKPGRVAGLPGRRGKRTEVGLISRRWCIGFSVLFCFLSFYFLSSLLHSPPLRPMAWIEANPRGSPPCTRRSACPQSRPGKDAQARGSGQARGAGCARAVLLPLSWTGAFLFLQGRKRGAASSAFW